MLILASKSPRPKEIMEKLRLSFVCVSKDCEESIPEGTPPERAVIMLATQKAEAVFSDYTDATVIGADTVVFQGGKYLTKPKDRTDAYNMLRSLSDKTHSVYTGVCIKSSRKCVAFYNKTDVTFSHLLDDDICEYLDTGEPFDIAGAYGIQGFGCKFIKCINGDFYSVMGLPAQMLAEQLKNFDY